MSSLTCFLLNTSHKLIVKIARKEELPDISNRVVWAPNLLLPIEGQETVLALTTGNGAVILNLDLITNDHGNEEIFLEDISQGSIIMPDCHKGVSGRCDIPRENHIFFNVKMTLKR